jgi:hypothetical protein
VTVAKAYAAVRAPRPALTPEYARGRYRIPGDGRLPGCDRRPDGAGHRGIMTIVAVDPEQQAVQLQQVKEEARRLAARI